MIAASHLRFAAVDDHGHASETSKRLCRKAVSDTISRGRLLIQSKGFHNTETFWIPAVDPLQQMTWRRQKPSLYQYVDVLRTWASYSTLLPHHLAEMTKSDNVFRKYSYLGLHPRYFHYFPAHINELVSVIQRAGSRKGF